MTNKLPSELSQWLETATKGLPVEVKKNDY